MVDNFQESNVLVVMPYNYWLLYQLRDSKVAKTPYYFIAKKANFIISAIHLKS